MKQFGELTEDGKSYKFEDKAGTKFNTEFKKLLDTEETLEFNKIKISDLGDITVEPRLVIDWLFEE